ncbi:Uncharacterised protein [uncultured archaeon]|nr:Uncharacterised protein [uncultured archaeon]
MTLDVISLVDITQTNVRNYNFYASYLPKEKWEHLRNQQRNWDVIVQLLSLRAQPFDITVPQKLTNQRPARWGFGWIYGACNTATLWKFSCRYETAIDLNLIRGDFQHVPIICGLEESFQFPNSCLCSTDNHANILLMKHIL